jgi:hypothetical protein
METYTKLSVFEADRDDQGDLRLYVNTEEPYTEEADGRYSALIAAAPETAAERDRLQAMLEDADNTIAAQQRGYEAVSQERDRLQAENAELRDALERILRANESDFEQCPGMDVKTAYETNSQAHAEARAALAKGEA